MYKFDFFFTLLRLQAHAKHTHPKTHTKTPTIKPTIIPPINTNKNHTQKKYPQITYKNTHKKKTRIITH